MRRRRYQKGSLKKRCGKWVGQWGEGERRRIRVLGPISSMTKSQARVALDSILAEIKGSQGNVDSNMSLALFVEQVYYPFYTRKWKRSTAANDIDRVNTHVLASFGASSVGSFHRDELQDFLDAKTGEGLSFSMVDHLRWDLKQVSKWQFPRTWLARTRRSFCLRRVPQSAARGW